jgi:hypothetical protein
MPERRYWLPPSQQPPPTPPPPKRCSGRFRYLWGTPMLVGGMGLQEGWAACIREPWDHDGNHLADIPGTGLREFPRA